MLGPFPYVSFVPFGFAGRYCLPSSETQKQFIFLYIHRKKWKLKACKLLDCETEEEQVK